MVTSFSRKMPIKTALKITGEDLNKLATLAGVPNFPPARTLFHHNIRVAVECIWHERLRRSQETPDVDALGRIAKAANILHTELATASPAAEDRLLYNIDFTNRSLLFAGRDQNAGVVRTAKFADYKAMITFFAELTKTVAGPATPPKVKRPRGRPRKPTSNNFDFDWFVEMLRFGTAETGGHFTFSNADEGRGTLIEALQLLAKWLPPGFIPNRPRISRLHRIQSHQRSLPRPAILDEREVKKSPR